MRYDLWRKSLVVGIALVFFGASIAMSTSTHTERLITVQHGDTGAGEHLDTMVNTIPVTQETGFLLIPDSTTDTVGMFDPVNGTYLGDLLTVPQIHGTLATPVNAVPGPDGNIYVSDQLQDAVFVFDISGSYLYEYANGTDGLNNIRGIDFRGGHLFITSGDDYVAEFDGPHSRLPDFINDGSDPFDILFLPDGRSLLADIYGSTDNVRLYDAGGNLEMELFSVSFPEQIQVDSVLPGGYLNVAFSASVITDFDLDGSIAGTTVFSSGRGVYRLGNGNLLATNGNGVWEIDPDTGGIVEQEYAGSSRFIELYTGGNQPPFEPSDPQPPDDAEGVEVDVNLSWIDGDPDPGDTVTYDVYLDKKTPPDQVAWDLHEETYDPEDDMEYNTTYYWKVVARDNHGLTTEGPIWSFTTEIQLLCGDVTNNGVIDVGDVVYLVNYLYRGGAPPIPMTCVGDVTCSGVVDIGDVVYLVNYLYRSGPPPCGECCG